MSPQVDPLAMPADGETSWGAKIRTAFETLRTAHNSTDSVAAGAASTAGSKYSLPGSGVPKTDMAAGVQTSLGKADTAIQSLTFANALPGQRFDWPRQGGNWVVRPTNRPDIFFDYRGSLPMPDGTAMNLLPGDAFVEEG